MTTANDVLVEARRWLGTREQPAGSNNVPGITDWYGLRGAWCAMFVSRVFFNAGMPLPASTAKGFAWVSAGFDWFRRQGWETFTDWRQARPGDLIAWEWGQTPGGYDHISIVEAQGPFTTIGGNERDQVKREFYGVPGGAALFARPPYDPAPTPTPGWTPTPGTSSTPRRATMRRLVNTDGRVEIFDLDPNGQVVNTWQGADGGLSRWAPITATQPGPFTSIDAFPAPDGRLCVIGYGAFGVLFISSQSAPSSGPWTDWVDLSKLLVYLASITKKA